MKFLFVVHRYAPYPGGSEYNVQRMAEEMVRRGHETWVLAGEHQGDLNGVHVTNILNMEAMAGLDLIIIHGGDVSVQNLVLEHTLGLQGICPVLYLIIKPSESDICLKGLKDAKFIGYSTPDDEAHLAKHKVPQEKRVYVPYGLNIAQSYGKPGFKKKYGIPEDKHMFLTSGGYWPNKGIPELVEVFNKCDIPDTVLVCTGYDNRFGLKPETKGNIIALDLPDPKEVLDAMTESDLYIMNSTEEGFGLVLLEAMLNRCPWIARDIAGARQLNNYGITYDHPAQLEFIMRTWNIDKTSKGFLDNAMHQVVCNHSVENTCDAIEGTLK